MKHKRNTYYDDPKDNTAYERCIDVMGGLILKYGRDSWKKKNRDNIRDMCCEDSHYVL